MKGYATSEGYMGLVQGRYMLFASEVDYREYMEDQIMKEQYLYDEKALEKYKKTHAGGFTLQRYKGLGEMEIPDNILK